MRTAFRLLVIPFVVVGCHREESKPPPKRPEPIPLDERAGLLRPIQVDSLMLTPIVARGPALSEPDVDMLTLDEAFEQKLITIKEMPSQSVNQLTLTNTSDKPLFVLAGEMIIGGKQDRIIGQNTIIAAKTTQEVPVFCVEHGRWSGESDVFASGKALAHGRLRGNASFENQSEVWREVAEKNQMRKTQNATDTYRQVASQQTNGTLAAAEARVKWALAKIDPADRAHMIGFIASLNGQVATIDRFNSPTLFRKLEGKLVRSYLTESIDMPAQPNATPPSVADVKTFMSEPEQAAPEPSYDTSESATIRYKAAKAAKARVEFKKGAMKSKPVYETYQRK